MVSCPSRREAESVTKGRDRLPNPALLACSSQYVWETRLSHSPVARGRHGRASCHSGLTTAPPKAAPHKSPRRDNLHIRRKTKDLTPLGLGRAMAGLGPTTTLTPTTYYPRRPSSACPFAAPLD